MQWVPSLCTVLVAWLIKQTLWTKHFTSSSQLAETGTLFSSGDVLLPRRVSAALIIWAWTLESPLDCMEIHPVHPKGDQSWIFIGRTDVEAETPILWPPDVKSWLIGKHPDAGKDWGQEEKGMTEVEMVGWYHWLNGHEFEQTPGDSERQRSLTAVCGAAKSQTRLVTECSEKKN